MTKAAKVLLVFMTSFVLTVTMSFVPVISGVAYAAAGDAGISIEDLEGKSIKELESNSSTKELVEDPELYKYYEVDSNGKLREKQVELDEVDKFIQKMDENAEGISDTEISKMSDNMYCVGCGVSGLGKADTPSKYKKYKRFNCLDISWWQGDISQKSWNKVKAAGVTHVIIRTSYTSLAKFQLNEDTKYGKNIDRAYEAGLRIGVYHFSQATTVKEARREAAYTVKLLENYKTKVKLPVVLDFETNGAGRLNMKKLKKLAKSGESTEICEAFCEKIKEAGYKPMIYANYTTLNSYLDYEKLQKKYRIWLANYTTNGKATTYPGEYWMWQYSSSGKVNGLKGSVDMNYLFTNGQGGSTRATKASSTSKTTTKSTSTTKSSTTKATTKTTTKSTTKKTAKTFKSYKAKTLAKLAYRTGPGKKYKKKGVFKKGAIVKVVGKSGSWSKLSNGYYASSEFLKKVVTFQPYKAKTASRVAIRTGPGTNYKKVDVFETGTTVKVVGKTGDWSKLSTGYYATSEFLAKSVKSYKVKTTTKLAYRTAPSKDYEKVGVYKKGKILTIVAVTPEWGKLSNGYYIKLKFTEKI